jgi:hypothetical protein
MTKKNCKQVLLRIPIPLLEQIDALAKKESRSRTAEICLLLDQLFNQKKSVAEVKDHE